jgi:carbamoyl-phosphate synthase small subunit
MENMPNISVLAPETEKLNNCVLELNDGSLWEGISFGAPTSAAGELVFQTGMVGYTESLTDPSYRGQILVLAYPMIGNYGVPPEELDEFDVPRYMESMDQSIHISGLIVMDYCFEPSHWLAVQSLASWLKKFNVPAVYGVDTRALIKKIRQHGVMLGKIVQTGLGENSNDIAFQDPNARHLVAEVSCKQPKIYGDKNPRANKTILMVDCGIKANQLRCFLSRDVKVKVVPWDYDFVDTDTAYDGLFLSNGPGDPTMCQVTIANLRKLIDRESKKESPLPIFGICLGNQLLGLASGAKTFKLKFGNRGQNQPCIDTRVRVSCLPSSFGFNSRCVPSALFLAAHIPFVSPSFLLNSSILFHLLPPLLFLFFLTRLTALLETPVRQMSSHYAEPWICY